MSDLIDQKVKELKPGDMGTYKNPGRGMIKVGTIRNWKLVDLPAIHKMMKYIPEMEIPEYDCFENCAKSGNYPDILVATADYDMPVGMVIYKTIPSYYGNNFTWLFCIAVEKEYRNQGIGRALLQFLKVTERSTEIDFICHKTNTEALKFYKKIGCSMDCDWVEVCLPIGDERGEE
jgi:GNAT superfamily N-acetyltransferase